ncbi:DUF6279 family lipoprotein [Ramlibacter rhizophilus]|uniref:Lipoprotein n=1 Tax=Ramlibacter rhizophilus TaxID=1781167 RepID=A0A4Z0BME8_9BURK|nr:DUF6279 family lipoprotein [Ramlibacter rhizophilus]TFY99579.1 hypothetical protein EZ242_10525 [Ramlibacter rhizophilus]
MTPALQLGRRIIGVLFACLLLAGCSALKLGYNSLPQLSYLWLDRYLGFDDEQAPQVRQALEELHRWHREVELPRAAELLARMEGMAGGELSAQQACTVAEAVRDRIEALAARAEPAVLRVALTLQDAQLERLAQRQARAAQEFRREWLQGSAAERLDRRVEQFEGHAKRLYGRLDPAQRRLLRERLQAARFDPERILAERRRRQADTLDTLRRVRAQADDPAEARRMLQGLVERFDTSPDGAWRQDARAMREDNCAVFAALHNTTSADQRQHAVQRLRDWRADLLALSVSP